jgi:hypothetical protein
MASRRVPTFLGLRIPQPHDPVAAAAGQQATAGREHHPENTVVRLDSRRVAAQVHRRHFVRREASHFQGRRVIQAADILDHSDEPGRAPIRGICTAKTLNGAIADLVPTITPEQDPHGRADAQARQPPRRPIDERYLHRRSFDPT